MLRYRKVFYSSCHGIGNSRAGPAFTFDPKALEPLEQQFLPSLRQQFGLGSEQRRIPPAERGVAEMMVNLYETYAARPDRCPSPAARTAAPQPLENLSEPQLPGPWQLPPVAMLNHRSPDLGSPGESQHLSELV
jgi:hypothetical protein